MFRAWINRPARFCGNFALPANQVGGPMTYMANGKQYIVIPIGTSRTHTGELVALALHDCVRCNLDS